MIAPIVLVALIAGYTAYWRWAAGMLDTDVANWIEQQRAGGVTITTEAPTTDGFPFSLRISFPKVAVSGVPQLPGATLTAPLLVGTARPWAFRQWAIELPRGGAIAMADGAPGPLRDLRTTTAKADLALGASAPTGGTAVTLWLAGLDGQLASGPVSVATVELTVVLPRRPPADHSEPSITLSLDVTKAVLPQPVTPLGVTIDHLGLQGRVMGAIPSGPLAASLGVWRDAGGTVELGSTALKWGPLDAAAEGTMAVDGNLQPIGALTATIRGYTSVLDALISSGQLRQNEANFARMGLALIAQKNASGESELKAPIRVQNSQIYLGPARLVKLPPIAWK
ncbi:MAG TPA: DUF2125 domain-containing protein [Stellaceae bacterium]|nr:DUF2125 domain-containing protein [Stellaceae bacterium]